MSDSGAVIGFVVCGAVIFFAGGRLSLYGDRLADITGLGRAWTGLILMAFVTSLPELLVGVSSVGIVGSADLAVGDVLGSCAINLVLLASLDAFVKEKRRLFGLASRSQVTAAALGIILLAAVAVGLLTRDALVLTPWIGVSSLLLIVLYLASVRVIYHQTQHGEDGSAEEPGAAALARLSAGQVIARYVMFAMLVVLAAVMLPPMAERIAVLTGLEQSFVGTVFLAVSTSLPELAVSLSAVRMGSIDLAVGNILGSNLFNILILAIDDLVYRQGILLADASASHLFTVLSTMAMSAVAIIGIQLGNSGKRFVLAGDAALILLLYATNAVLLLTMTI